MSIGIQMHDERQDAKSPRILSAFRWRLGVLAFILLFMGCHSAKLNEPMAKEMMGSDADAQINFWHTLTDLPVCSNDAAFHGLLLYLDSKDECADYNERVSLLKSRRMLPQGFNAPADAAVSRGTLAIAICEALNIKGGVTMRVLHPFNSGAPEARYAARELQFMNLYPPGSPQQTFSGNEYVGIIGRLEDFQRGDSADKTAEEAQGHGETAPATQSDNPG
jgi:hypothetical protein